MYYFINGKILDASKLDGKRKKMYEDRGYKQMTMDEINAILNT